MEYIFDGIERYEFQGSRADLIDCGVEWTFIGMVDDDSIYALINNQINFNSFNF